MKYTKRQAEYVTFIYYYTKIHGRAPAEHEIVNGKVKVYQFWENKSVPPLWERNGL